MSSGPKATGIAAGATRVHYVWDAWNRLAAVWQDDGDGTLETGGDDTLLLTCRYDGLHRRIAKTDEGMRPAKHRSAAVCSGTGQPKEWPSAELAACSWAGLGTTICTGLRLSGAGRTSERGPGR